LVAADDPSAHSSPITAAAVSAPADVQAKSTSWEPSVSADGRYVAFQSDATNVVTGDTNGATEVFVYDRQAGTTTRACVGERDPHIPGTSTTTASSTALSISDSQQLAPTSAPLTSEGAPGIGTNTAPLLVDAAIVKWAVEGATLEQQAGSPAAERLDLPSVPVGEVWQELGLPDGDTRAARDDMTGTSPTAMRRPTSAATLTLGNTPKAANVATAVPLNLPTARPTSVTTGIVFAGLPAAANAPPGIGKVNEPAERAAVRDAAAMFFARLAAAERRQGPIAPALKRQAPVQNPLDVVKLAPLAETVGSAARPLRTARSQVGPMALGPSLLRQAVSTTNGRREEDDRRDDLLSHDVQALPPPQPSSGGWFLKFSRWFRRK
jgi:hypothetical protein